MNLNNNELKRTSGGILFLSEHLQAHDAILPHLTDAIHRLELDPEAALCVSFGCLQGFKIIRKKYSFVLNIPESPENFFLSTCSQMSHWISAGTEWEFNSL